MANYLISHYKGKYRIKCDCDENTHQFTRKLDGTYEDIDCYITCYNDIKIFYFGKSILEAYIPSIIRGNNIIKSINESLGDDIIFDVSRSNAEVMFKFKTKYMEVLEPYLKPKTNGASISPFSSKNLPKNKDYKIPDKDLSLYKFIVQKIGQKRIIELTHMTNNYLKTLVTKSRKWEDIKADMALKGLSGNNYIHSIGEWGNFIQYLTENMSI